MTATKKNVADYTPKFDTAKPQSGEATELPHHWLVRVMLGEAFEIRRAEKIVDERGKFLRWEETSERVYPDFAMRMDAAKAAAPYFSARIAAQTVSVDTVEGGGVMLVPVATSLDAWDKIATAQQKKLLKD